MASNGRVAILAEFSCDDEQSTDVILHRSICSDITRYEGEKHVEIVGDSTGGIHITDQFHGISCRSQEGRYPNFRNFFTPAEGGTTVIVDAYSLRRTLNTIIKMTRAFPDGKARVAITVSDSQNHFALTAGDGECRIAAAIATLDFADKKQLLWWPEFEAEGGL